jgi:hypothetical protein
MRSERGSAGWRYWDRTSDLCRVKAERGSCEHWRFGQNPIQNMGFRLVPTLGRFGLSDGHLTDTLVPDWGAWAPVHR